MLRRAEHSPTILDVAREAGVSYTTVSLVLNKTPGRKISEATRKQVLKAVEKLNYQPNIVARSMRTKRTHTIGVLISDIFTPLFSQSIAGIEEVASHHEYDIIVCNVGAQVDFERERIRFLLQKQVDGVILVSHSRPVDNSHLKELQLKGMPLVLVNRDLQDPDISNILIDNVQGAASAVEHLVKLGHRRIAGIMAPLTGPSFCRASMRSFEGYKYGLESAGIPYDGRLVVEEPDLPASEVAGYKMAKKLFGSLQPSDRPTAIYCANDFLAFGAIRALYEEGMRVPNDVAIVGHDNTRAGLSFIPTLTSVAQPLLEAGRIAATILFDKISGENLEPVQMKLPCKLFIRESCGARKGSDAKLEIWERDSGFLLT